MAVDQSDSNEIPDDSWRQCESIIDRFEQAWRETGGAELAAFVPPVRDPLRRRLLLHLIKVDQEYRWKAGDRKTLETYLQEWPELEGDDDALIELIVAQCQTQAAFASRPTDAEIQQRFPGVADQIDLTRILIDAGIEQPAQPRHIRCPHCRAPIELAMAASLKRLFAQLATVDLSWLAM